MKKGILLFIIVLACSIAEKAQGQRYEVLNYHLNGTPANGIKIKTKIPFVHGGSMPTVRIEGYFYGKANPIGLDIVWYTYNNKFVHAKVSSWGAVAPPIYLSNENGYISIFIDKKPFYPRFAVSVFSEGRKTDKATSFTGWSVVDEQLSGTNQLQVPYVNRFGGTVSVSGNLLVNKTIQANPAYKLDVNGNIRADKVVINTTGADYVFDSTYKLLSLDSVNSFIKKYKHLPGIPSAAKLKSHGTDLGELIRLQLQKIEELTIYIIRKNKQLLTQQATIKQEKQRIDRLEKEVKYQSQLLKEYAQKSTKQ